MISNRGLLSAFLLLLPAAMVLNGLGTVLYGPGILLLLAWPQLKRLQFSQLKSGIRRGGLSIVALLTAWPFVTCLWSINPNGPVVTAKLLFIFTIGLLGLSLARLRTASQDTTPWKFLGFGMILAILLIALEQFPAIRILSPIAALLGIDGDNFHHKNINKGLCALVICVWPCVIGLMVAGKTRLALWLPLLVLPAIWSLHSMTAKTAMLTGMGIYYAMLLFPRRGAQAVVIVMPLLFSGWPLIFTLLEPFLRQPEIYSQLPASSQHRIEIWAFVREQWALHPWFGWGADSSRVLPGGGEFFQYDWVKLPLHPHNIPFQLLLEQGVIGLMLTGIALVLFSCKALNYTVGMPKVQAAVAAGISSFIIVCLFGFSMWQAWLICAAILSCWLVAYMLSEQKLLKNS